MEKLNLFSRILIILVISNSCSSENNNIEQTKDLIIGTWKATKEVDVCSTGSEDVYNYSSCEQTGRVTFLSDGTINITEYDDENGNCEQYHNSNGTWKLNDNILTVSIDGETNTPTFFELTQNTLQIGYYDADPNDPCDGGQLPSHYYVEFIRIQ